MPSWGSGLASALTQGAVGYGEQSELNRRELLAAAARKRAEQREQEQDEIRRIEALTRAAGSGLEVTPRPDPTVPEVTPVPPIPASGPEAGAAVNPPKTRNVGRIGGYDVAIPEGGVQDPTVRRQDAARKQRLQNLEAAVGRLPAGHRLKRPPEELAMIADNDAAYRAFVEEMRQPPLADRVAEERALNPEKFDGRAPRSGDDGIDKDARSRRRQYDARVNNLKATFRREWSAAMGPDKKRLQENYYNARADLANEFSDVAPQADLDPNTRAGAPKPTAGRVNTPGNRGEAPDDVVMAALQQFGGDQAKALAHLRSQGYR